MLKSRHIFGLFTIGFMAWGCPLLVHAALPQIHMVCRDQLQKRIWIRCNVRVVQKDHSTKKLKALIRIRKSEKIPKKSYTLSFKKKKRLLPHLYRSDNWVLESCYFDPTMLRTKLSQDLFDAVSPEQPAPRSTYVEVFLDGKDEGLYLLGERVNRDLLDLPPFQTALHPQAGIFKMAIQKRFKKQVAADGHLDSLVYNQVFPDLENTGLFLKKDLMDLLRLPYPFSLDETVDFYLHALLTGNRQKGDFYVWWRPPSEGQPPQAHLVPSNNHECFGIRNRTRLEHPYRWYARFPSDTVMKEPAFRSRLKQRWFDLRADRWSDESINKLLQIHDVLIQEARKKNYQRWPYANVSSTLDVRGMSLRQNRDYLKYWIQKRIQFLDQKIKEMRTEENAI